MRSSFATAFLAAAAGLINPLVVAAADVNAAPVLTWTGEVIPGKGHVTLTGDGIQDILTQIHVISPDYDASTGTADHIIMPVNKIDAPTSCGIFATADKRNFMQSQYALRKAGGDCKIAARLCMRVSCWNTSGIYVCNDNDHEVTIPCTTVADYASHVGATCCNAKPATESKGTSGQAFSDQGWNVDIAYGNCNHAPDRDPPSIFGRPGPNGECAM